MAADPIGAVYKKFQLYGGKWSDPQNYKYPESSVHYIIYNIVADKKYGIGKKT